MNINIELNNQVNRILLLKLKTLILKNLKSEDLTEFNELIKQNNTNTLLQFASSRIPDLAGHFFDEIYDLKQRLENSIKKCA